jgi:hypothetical protein
VIQSDRDFAADLAQWLTDAQKEWDGMAIWFAADAPRAFRDGAFDAHEFVQAFAKHRLAHAKEQAGLSYAERLEYEERILAAEMRAVALTRALKPFAAKADKWEANHEHHGSDSTQVQHRLGDFRAARSVVAEHGISSGEEA